MSCPHTPEQNGVSERKNRHIRETAVTLLQNASLPSGFWYYACALATYLINRMPTQTLAMLSPFEKLYHKVPGLGFLRVFGCACYPLLTSQRVNKLQPKTIKCVFIGLAAGYKGFMCYNMVTKRIILSRHVFFDESDFPYACPVIGQRHGDVSATTTSISAIQPCLSLTQAPSHLPALVTHTSSGSSASSTCVPQSFPDIDPLFSSDTADINTVENNNAIGSSSSACDSDHDNNITGAQSSSIALHDQERDSSTTLFDSQSHTQIHFNDSNGDVAVQSEPGIGISIVLDCASSQSLSNISESNILHPVEGLTPKIVNDHPMITRGKRGISKQKCFLSAMISSLSDPAHTEPHTVKRALQVPEWQHAMQEEYDALMKQQTWTLVPLPPEKNLVSCKWIFKLKQNADGSIARHKARLVARGFSQEYGIDYDETFSPVVRHTTVRMILGLAAHSGWKLHQMDVKNAFLHGVLTEEVYMSQPTGFVDPQFPNHVCRLEKSLYGLKQAPRAWNDRFTSFLPSIGFKFSHADPSLFIKVSGTSRVFLLLYVDDIIITGDSEALIAEVKAALLTEFDMKDLGELHFFLGLQIQYLQNGLFVSQHKYATDLIHKAGLESCNSHVTPCQSGLKLYTDEGTPLCPTDASHFRSLVGCLQYLTFTRPDIAYAVNSVCQFLHNPTDVHLNAVKRILRYVNGTLDTGLVFKKGNMSVLHKHTPLRVNIQAFCDADWAGDPNDRKSTTGFVILMNGTPISWCSKKQSAVSRSSTEAEYRSMADTTSELQWLLILLSELHVDLAAVPVLHCDNISALALATNPVHHSKLKHIEVDVHFTRAQVKAGTIRVQFISTKEQLADLFTKGLCSPQHTYLCGSLMLRPQHQAEGGC